MVVHPFQEGVVAEVVHPCWVVAEVVAGQPSLVVEEAVVGHSCQKEAEEVVHPCQEGEVEVAE